MPFCFTAPPDDREPGRQVLRFLTAWTRALHTLRYTFGVCSNSLSGISDLASNYANPSYAMPDIIYDALWNGAADTRDPVGPATDWARHQCIHQYLGGQNVTYGGDTTNIDQDYLDVQRPALAGGSAQASPAGRDGQIWVIRRKPRSRWTHPANLGMGRLGGAPAATGLASGEVDVC